jgi:hypothetical protein
MARGTCSSCGRPVYVGRSSLPEPICHPCRRQAWGLPPDGRVKELQVASRQPRPRLSQCRRCDGPVPAGRRAYCSPECARRNRRQTKRPSAHARGYGRQHELLRLRLLPQAYGQDCHLCGAVMLQDQELHLDHTPDRAGYRGMAHAWCNNRDGLQRAQEALRRKRLGVGA